jgi:hypothetical protein
MVYKVIIYRSGDYLNKYYSLPRLEEDKDGSLLWGPIAKDHHEDDNKDDNKKDHHKDDKDDDHDDKDDTKDAHHKDDKEHDHDDKDDKKEDHHKDDKEDDHDDKDDEEDDCDAKDAVPKVCDDGDADGCVMGAAADEVENEWVVSEEHSLEYQIE